jgi:hypothetical protein
MHLINCCLNLEDQNVNFEIFQIETFSKQCSCLPATDSEMTLAANIAVTSVISEKNQSDPRGKKRGMYGVYDSTTRAKIGRHAAQFGNKAAVERFSNELGHPVNESSLQFVISSQPISRK